MNMKWKTTGDPGELLLHIDGKSKAQLSMMERGTWAVFFFDDNAVEWYADLAGIRGKGDQSKAQLAVEKIAANINNDSDAMTIVRAYQLAAWREPTEEDIRERKQGIVR